VARLAAIIAQGPDTTPALRPGWVISWSPLAPWQPSASLRSRRQRLGNVPARLVHGLMMPSRGSSRVGSRVAAQRGGDIAVAAQAQDADGGVAQAGHGPWGVAGAELRRVLGEGGVADVVQRLDAQ
jgi:hypothetical protein